MEDRNEMDKIDDVMLPGFRFHPTDEELVDFYLRRKIQQRTLPIELIKQVDIYKYDPWDLPRELASSGEKEWYFYCPRDRKYRNSARPNRVTRAGFWKATGTDRPIYSSGGKCIGLKKSLVFYRGRAAKGIKTDWMMHEFRLPSLSDSSHPPPPKKPFDKSFPPSDSWAICRIFKKTNSMSMAQKALTHPWITQLSESMVSEILSQSANHNHFTSENISCTTETGSASAIQLCTGKKKELHVHEQVSNASSDIAINNSTVSASSQTPVSNGVDPASSFMFSSFESSGVPAYIGFEGPNQQYSGFSVSVPHDIQGMNMSTETVEDEQSELSKQWETGKATGFPFSLLLPFPNEAWKSNLSWDSPPCPSDMSTTYSPN